MREHTHASKSSGTFATCGGVAKYKMTQTEVGRGRYSTVVEGIDIRTNVAVAIKKMKKDTVQDKDFQREARILNRLSRLPVSNAARFSEILDHFSTQIDHCVVFPRYGKNLHNILNDKSLAPLPLFQARELTLQLIYAVAFLHRHGFIHTDLNTKNMVLVDSGSTGRKMYGADGQFTERRVLNCTEMKLIDFGSVGEDVLCNEGLVGSRGYQAPEVIMGWAWTETIDHFAVGCIISELVTSRSLLPTELVAKEDTLAAMNRILGPFPEEVAKKIAETRPKIKLANSRRGEFHSKKVIADVQIRYIINQLTVLSGTNRGNWQDLENRARSGI
ncbi:kinase-like domain-containing protein [Mycena rebaudengoi]|nr:kinase-like domain-containing protein [Mycena rebaudengoi]